MQTTATYCEVKFLILWQILKTDAKSGAVMKERGGKIISSFFISILSLCAWCFSFFFIYLFTYFFHCSNLFITLLSNIAYTHASIQSRRDMCFVNEAKKNLYKYMRRRLDVSWVEKKRSVTHEGKQNVLYMWVGCVWKLREFDFINKRFLKRNTIRRRRSFA
jgi:hypothetical protein